MSYRTLKKSAEYSMTERKSEFIGYCAPVKTEEEAIAFVNAIKKKHSDARHNVYAYVLREGYKERFSDDGEPHGTAGMPVLDSIRKAGLTDTAVVVTRYFGGILLGTGGLVRAYTAAAVGALNEGGVAEIGEFALVSAKAGYSEYQKLMPLISSRNAKVKDSDFGSDVRLTLMVKKDEANRFIEEVTDATNGRVLLEIVGEVTDFI